MTSLDELRAETHRCIERARRGLSGTFGSNALDAVAANFDSLLARVAAAEAERDALLADVDLALARYGMAATATLGADDEQRAVWFEEARLALRRVREVLAAPVPSGPAEEDA